MPIFGQYEPVYMYVADSCALNVEISQEMQSNAVNYRKGML